MQRLALLSLVLVLSAHEVFSQVFILRRPANWYLQSTPSIGLFFGHTGIDEVSGTSVSDVFRWGAGLTVNAGAKFTRFMLDNRLRLEYQESYSTGRLPVRGPSILDFTVRPGYRLFKDSAFDVDLALQAGLYSSLFPETNTEGETIRRFLDPASIYEGVFLSKESQFGQSDKFMIGFQVGYALQQLVYRTHLSQPDVGSLEGNAVYGGESSSANGLAAFLSLDYLAQLVQADNGSQVLAFSLNTMLKAFQKETRLHDFDKSRCQAMLRTTLTVLEMFDFTSGLELVYDNAISTRRELRTSVSINFHYNLDVSEYR